MDLDYDVFPIAVVAALQIVAMALAAGVWRGRGRVVAKLLWTGVLAMPLVGLIAYALWHETPPPPAGRGRTLPP